MDRKTQKEYTRSQAARFLGVPYNTVKYRLRVKKLTHRRTEYGEVLIPRRALLAYKKERTRRGLR